MEVFKWLKKKDKERGTWYFYGKYDDPITQTKKNYKQRGYESKTKARLAEADFLKNIDDKNNGIIIFKDLRKEYFEYLKSTNRDSSIVSQKNKSKNHLNPFFDNMYVDKITVNTIKEWKKYMNDKDLSLNYRKYIFVLLHSILNYGCKYYNIKNNAAAIEGNFKSPKTTVKKEMQFFTLDDFEKFDNSIDDLVYKALFNLLYWTGCRRGEAIALKWEDFSKGFKTVSINKSCTHKVKGTPFLITPPKNSTSIRTISIPNRLILILQQLYKVDSKIDGFNDKFFVFGKIAPLHDTTIERYKNKYCKLANVKKIRVHDFRHSHASYLINNMPNDKNIILAISKRLGHSSPTTTLQVYAHMMPEQEDEIIKMLNK